MEDGYLRTPQAARNGSEEAGADTRSAEQGPSEPAVPAPPKPKLRKEPQHEHKSVGKYLRDFARPAYHIRRLKEDLRASVHALRNRDIEQLKSDEESLAKALRGRLLATYFLVGPFGLMGPITGTWFQYWVAPHLPFASTLTFLVTVAAGNFFSILGFQIIWAFTARPLYSRRGHPFNVVGLWKDILPMQWRGFQRWAIANTVLMPVSMIALSLIDHYLPWVGHTVPVGILTPGLEIIFVHTSLVRLMGDLFDYESRRIAYIHAH